MSPDLSLCVCHCHVQTIDLTSVFSPFFFFYFSTENNFFLQFVRQVNTKSKISDYIILTTVKPMATSGINCDCKSCDF